MASYIELLRDPRWQRKRLEILDRDGWACLQCSRKDRTLHVHHTSYVYGKKPWEYDAKTLRTLCESCHDEETGIQRRLKSAHASLATDSRIQNRMLGYAESFVVLMGDTKRLKLLSAEYTLGVADACGLTQSEVYEFVDGDFSVDPLQLWDEGMKRRPR